MTERNSDGTFRIQPPKSFKDYHYKPLEIKSCMALVLYKRHSPFRYPRFTQHCLIELGLALPPHFKTLWRNDNAFVEELLERATYLYGRLRFHFHPRTLDDNPEPAQSLHALWTRIKKLFHNRLHPAYVINRNLRRSKVITPRGHLLCVVCKKPFKPKRKRRIDPVCSNTCWSRKFRKRRPRVQVRCVNPRCNVQFIPKHGAKYHSPACATSHRKRRKREANLEFFRKQSRDAYWRNRPTILANRKRRGVGWSALPEQTKVIYRKRAAEAGFRKRQLEKRLGAAQVECYTAA